MILKVRGCLLKQIVQSPAPRVVCLVLLSLVWWSTPINVYVKETSMVKLAMVLSIIAINVVINTREQNFQQTYI